MSPSKLCRMNIGRLLDTACPEANAGTRAYFISFLGSRIDDPRDFQEAFGVTGKYKVFGGKEKRTDATSHYHVLMVSEQAMTVTDGVDKFKMWYNFDFQDEVDTYDIQIRVRRDEQYSTEFLKLVQTYLSHVIDPGTTFGDQDLSPFAAEIESSIGRDTGGLFQVGDNSSSMDPLTYPGTKSIAAFLSLEDYPPARMLVCKCIEVCPGTRICSMPMTLDRACEDEVDHAWSDRVSCNWY
ncbi:hypothetical protein NXS19_008276 [Fusarium pseudograminearum]|nr:hypothetical protein NXS19_008276 [Fusarium pseudograminearum]